MQIADDIALYAFGNNGTHRIMDLRRKLAVVLTVLMAILAERLSLS